MLGQQWAVTQSREAAGRGIQSRTRASDQRSPFTYLERLFLNWATEEEVV